MTIYLPTIPASLLAGKRFTHASVYTSAILWMVLILLLIVCISASAGIIREKTPADVYQQVQFLTQDVLRLRQKNGITAPWPHIAVKSGRQPRHVYQKTLEILDKINRYRTNILKIGGISIPVFPGRDITPNEVFEMVVRLRQELALLVKNEQIKAINQTPLIRSAKNSGKITPNEVYAALSEVAIAIEQTLGIRSISPSDVYVRSVQVLQLSRFLRQSQNLPLTVKKPEKTNGKLPNHALQSVYELLNKIAVAEKNLWLKPVEVPPLAQRVIHPSDVYDAMGIALAELQRMQYRLGLERGFVKPPRKKGKTPDDVIQNTRWASALLPQFPLRQPLIQYDRQGLVKTPNHVYSLTSHILKELKRYRHFRGIHQLPERAAYIKGVQPEQVYENTLNIMAKINLLRKTHHMGAMAVPTYPLRRITPAEVFMLVLRLDDELGLIYSKDNFAGKSWLNSMDIQEYVDKTPSDVFYITQQISHLLDTLIGNNGFTTPNIYHQLVQIKQEVLIITAFFGEKIPATLWQDEAQRKDSKALMDTTSDTEIFHALQQLLALVYQMQKRAGIFQVRAQTINPGTIINATDVYNLLQDIKMQLIELKLTLGIEQIPPPLVTNTNAIDKRDIVRQIKNLQQALTLLLHQPLQSASKPE